MSHVIARRSFLLFALSLPLSASVGAAPPAAKPLSCDGLPGVKICESLADGRTGGTQPLGKGAWTKEGWRVTDETSQIKHDLGGFYSAGIVEFEVKGPLEQTPKRTIFAAWPTEDASETVEQRDKEKKAAFHQVRLFEGGMMLRFSHRPSRSNLEKGTGAIAWKKDGWHHVKSEWNTDGGVSRLWVDGKEVLSGTYKVKFPGFRWVFLGRDNYRPNISVAIPGLVFRNYKVYGLRPALAAK